MNIAAASATVLSKGIAKRLNKYARILSRSCGIRPGNARVSANEIEEIKSGRAGGDQIAKNKDQAADELKREFLTAKKKMAQELALPDQEK